MHGWARKNRTTSHIATPGFDPWTSGLWAPRATSAPSCCEIQAAISHVVSSQTIFFELGFSEVFYIWRTLYSKAIFQRVTRWKTPELSCTLFISSQLNREAKTSAFFLTSNFYVPEGMALCWMGLTVAQSLITRPIICLSKYEPKLKLVSLLPSGSADNQSLTRVWKSIIV